MSNRPESSISKVFIVPSLPTTFEPCVHKASSTKPIVCRLRYEPGASPQKWLADQVNAGVQTAIMDVGKTPILFSRKEALPVHRSADAPAPRNVVLVAAVVWISGSWKITTIHASSAVVR